MTDQVSKPSKALGNAALLLSLGGSMCVFLGPWGAAAGVCLGIVAIALELRAPARHSGGGAAMAAILIGSGGVWFFYSQGPYISSRGELRSRSSMAGASEASAQGGLRELVTVEQAYAEANAGFYDTPQCLREPRRCLPAYPDGSPRLAASWLGFSTTGAYVVTFHPGASVAADEIQASKASASSLKSYAAVAVPRRPGETGRRAFCIDSSGVLRATRDGSPPAVALGSCAASTPPLR